MFTEMKGINFHSLGLQFLVHEKAVDCLLPPTTSGVVFILQGSGAY